MAVSDDLWLLLDRAKEAEDAGRLANRGSETPRAGRRGHVIERHR